MGRKNGQTIEEVHVGEELKSSVALSLRKFADNESQKELEFPSSLTVEEQQYIQFVSKQHGFKSASRGKGKNRFLTVYKKGNKRKESYRLLTVNKKENKGKDSDRFLKDDKEEKRGKGVFKKEGSTVLSKKPILQLSDVSQSMVRSLLQRFPVTDKERQDLLPCTEKDTWMNPELRDLNLVPSLGRLTRGPPQIPPLPLRSKVTAEGRNLPVWEIKDQLLNAINHNQVIMVRGETGSGKTTQVPQIILGESSTLSKPCRIFCTQSRRISAISVAERVAAERGEEVGYTVGYQIRLEEKLSPNTMLSFCTTGILLRILMRGQSSLTSVTHILVDEVHVRDKFTDFLLTVLRDWLPKLRHMKLLLMSANLDTSLYAKYFNNCPVIDVPGRTFAVKSFYLEDVLKFTSYQSAFMKQLQIRLEKKRKGQKEASKSLKSILKNLKAMPLEKGKKKGGNGHPLKEPKKENEQENGDPLEEQKKENGENGHPLEEPKKEKGQGNGHPLEEPKKENGAKEVEIGGSKYMDRCIEMAFISGQDEYFSQLLYFMKSENVSPDYQHSTTWASSLMVAAGRGRMHMVKQLLALGATVDLRAANEWSAADWAHSTGQQKMVDYLQSYSACEGIVLKASENSLADVTTSQEDKKLLEAYTWFARRKTSDTDLIFALTLKIHLSQPIGGILIFLPGYEDIVSLRDRISENEEFIESGGKYSIFCLHSRMQSIDQKAVFRSSPRGVRKIVLSTNIAETSVTINDIVYVIDCGKIKEISFDALSGVSCLQAVPISQASVMQRRGRAGRCQPGIAYHLFSRSSFSLLQPYQTPEILRSPLQDLCLHTKLLTAPNTLIADFLARAPEPPTLPAVKNAIHLLKNMDALDPWEGVTELGHHLLDLSLPPNLGKMVITSTIMKCLDPVLTIAACLAYRDPFVLPSQPSDKNLFKNVRRKFVAGTLSDHMVLLKAFQAWELASTEWSQLGGWCERNFISRAAMDMIHGIRAQVLAQLRSSGFVRARGPGDIRDVNSNSDNWAVVKAALLSGIYPNLIRVDRNKQKLRTEKEKKVRLHLSSVLIDFDSDDPEKVKDNNLENAHKILVSSMPTDWLLYDEMIRIGGDPHVKRATLLSSVTVLLMAGPMRLPLDALTEPSNRNHRIGCDLSSDGEIEDRPQDTKSSVKIDSWVQFLGDHPTASLALQLRHKLQSLILRKLRAPNKPLTQSDEDIVRVVAMVLSHEEQLLGLQQDPGVGQRTRPFYSNQPDINGISVLNLTDSEITPILGATSVPPTNTMTENSFMNSNVPEAVQPSADLAPSGASGSTRANGGSSSSKYGKPSEVSIHGPLDNAKELVKPRTGHKPKDVAGLPVGANVSVPKGRLTDHRGGSATDLGAGALQENAEAWTLVRKLTPSQRLKKINKTRTGGRGTLEGPPPTDKEQELPGDTAARLEKREQRGRCDGGGAERQLSESSTPLSTAHAREKTYVVARSPSTGIRMAITRENFPSEKMSRRDYELVKARVLTVIDETPGDTMIPLFACFELRAGALIIQCESEMASVWLRELFHDSSEVVKGTKLKVLRAAELPKPVNVPLRTGATSVPQPKTMTENNYPSASLSSLELSHSSNTASNKARFSPEKDKKPEVSSPSSNRPSKSKSLSASSQNSHLIKNNLEGTGAVSWRAY